MYVNIGNSSAIEGYRDATSSDPDLVRYRPLEGERITEIVFPPGTTLNAAFSNTLAIMDHHMTSGATPVWIESDSEGLTGLLQEHYGITTSSAPRSWGKDTGAEAFSSAKKTEEK